MARCIPVYPPIWLLVRRWLEECQHEQRTERGMADPRSPQQDATEAQLCCNPDKHHGCQHVVCGDPDTHRHTGRTSDIIMCFQTGQPEREPPRAEEPRQD